MAGSERTILKVPMLTSKTKDSYVVQRSAIMARNERTAIRKTTTDSHVLQQQHTIMLGPIMFESEINTPTRTAIESNVLQHNTMSGNERTAPTEMTTRSIIQKYCTMMPGCERTIPFVSDRVSESSSEDSNVLKPMMSGSERKMPKMSSSGSSEFSPPSLPAKLLCGGFLFYFLASISLGALTSGLYELATGGFNPNMVISVAFIGNSIQFYNDFPRTMEAVSGNHIKQNSCLRGGASFQTILTKGSGMRKRWKTDNAKKKNGKYDTGARTVERLLMGKNGKGLHWDFVVMNDRTFHPASNDTLARGCRTLKKKYLPMFLNTSATPVFLANHACRNATNRTIAFGDFEEYTHLLLEGYGEYKVFIDDYLPENQTSRVAPVGKAFLQVYEEDSDLWYRLYNWDGIHPSPHGTYLQAIVMYCTLYGHPPPKRYALPRRPSKLWDRARRMQPKDQPALDWPTLGEMQYLYEVGTRVALSFDYRVITSHGYE